MSMQIVFEQILIIFGYVIVVALVKIKSAPGIQKDHLQEEILLQLQLAWCCLPLAYS